MAKYLAQAAALIPTDYIQAGSYGNVWACGCEKGNGQKWTVDTESNDQNDWNPWLAASNFITITTLGRWNDNHLSKIYSTWSDASNSCVKMCPAKMLW